MTRLVKYLKPFTSPLLIAIILLFIQANADLALPDYMSRIVNVGIQQGGVENAVPVAIRQSEMDKLTLFLSEDDRNSVLADYALIDQDTPDYDAYVADYPALASEPIYVLNEIAQAEIDHLNPVMGKALLVVFGIEQVMADPSKAPSIPMGGNFDLSRIPPGMDVFALLRTLPEAQRAEIIDQINTGFDSMEPTLIVQGATRAIKAEYEALGMDTGKRQNDYIVRTGGVMLLLALLSAVCTITVSFLSARIAAGMARKMRKDIFQKVEDFSSAEFDHFSTASLITRSTNDITQIQMVVIMMVRMVFYAPIIGVGGIIRAVNKDSSMWWIIALAVMVLVGLVLIGFTIALPKFKRIQALIDRLNLVMRENLSGMMVIRAFNMQSFELNRFDKANQDLTDTMLFISRIVVIMMPLMMLIMNGLSLLIIWVGSHQVAESNMQVGDMMAFLQYSMQIVFSFLMLTMMFIILPRASVSADRIADVLETAPTIRDPQAPQKFSALFKATVEFRNVCFRYPGAEEDVLHDISFTAQPGQTTAFIGSTGSGKSTVVNLIPRFYDVTGGAILIDSLDIREVTQHDLRDRIGYVPQKGTLFSGTIDSNLRYADENAAADALEHAAEVAQASEVITTASNGLDSEVAQGGMNFSGGQKQRLSIARALVKQAPIYIFDDSFSSLDFRTDAALRRALKEDTGGSTILIVTQRISTIKNAEQIIVLDEGRIAGQGTHRELMQTCEPYREIALSQLS